MELLRTYPERVFMGFNAENTAIYLLRPEWDCGWYWAFGYLVGHESHYHLSGLDEAGNLHTQLLAHFPEQSQQIDDERIVGAVHAMNERETLWTFCEVAQTIYALKNTAEVLGRGGSHYTTNPCRELIQNQDEVIRLNSVVIPHLIDAMYVALGVVEPLEYTPK